MLPSSTSTAIYIPMMVKSTTSPSNPALQDELQKLHLRRIALDKLIQSLEDYHERFSSGPAVNVAALTAPWYGVQGYSS